MRQSQLFTKTRREAPSDEVAKNAQLLIRGGFVHKEMAGVYSLLPLGLRVVDKINGIIREEMNAIGGQEVFLSALQNPEIWKKTDRWTGDADEIWFKTKLNVGGELGLGFTHEEPLTNIMRDHISSYKDLPKYAYQIQTKFRNESRAKSGVLRGREFLMKDLYSFCKTQEEQDAFYARAQEAYHRVFARVGLGDRTYLTFASGGVFSKYSHEFQTLCETGEDTIFVDEKKKIAVNKEVCTDAVLADLEIKRADLVERTAVEVGNIFSLGTRFSAALNLTFKDETGKTQPVVMGSYGIGPTRLLGVIAEVYGDDAGLVWPESVAPFDVHVVVLESREGKGVHTYAEEITMHLEHAGKTVLYDDRDASAGQKFADSDLIGIPIRIVVSEKHLGDKTVEVKRRTERSSAVMPLAGLLAALDAH
jgi:prolyl-tRNA synthetase